MSHFTRIARAIARERAAGFALLCLFLGLALLLVGACNTQGFPPAPPPPGGGGPGGGGGRGQPNTSGTGGVGIISGGPGGHSGPGPYDGGPGGAGAAGGAGNTDCLNGSFSCVSSCAMSVPATLSGSCDSNGSLICPAGYLRLSTCAPNACARRTTFYCCDLTTGAIAQPPCDPDGLTGNCAVGTMAVKSYMCVPPALGVTDCRTLDGQACDLLDRRCQSPDLCVCEHGGDAGGLVWFCAPPGGSLP